MNDKYLTPYACVNCRKVFKRPYVEDYLRKCPNCENQEYQMDVRFRAPKTNNDKQWAKIEYLIQQGFFFIKFTLKKVQCGRGSNILLPLIKQNNL